MSVVQRPVMMSDLRLANSNSCCRLCLSDSMDNLKSIFDDGADDRGLQQKISATLGVEILMDDKLSTMVCSQCIEKVINWQTFKNTCNENQNKLEQWMNVSNSEMDMNILIKEEPIENVTLSPQIVQNGEISMKHEPTDDEFDLPPPLTPQGEEHGEVEIVQHSPVSEETNNPCKCTMCGKILSSRSNRKKHERVMHGILPGGAGTSTESEVESSSQDDRSQNSVDSHTLAEATSVDTDNAQDNKILFAAGLKLFQRNSTPPISSENLSRIELSYIEKCKAMVNMYRTLKCACHNVSHPNLKGLLSHLRALRIWFPVFTCYHCMITFTDRSASTKHYVRCTKTNLETLVKLSNLKKRSEVKTRLYQNYKCSACKFMFSFHEDFCTHVDEEHSQVPIPYTCDCGRIFTTQEDYKDHAYISCLVDYYCDICFVTVKTIDEFQKHATELHDNSEGFVLLQDDNYRQRKYSPVASKRPSVKREYTDESNIITGKRRISYKPPIIDDDDDKVLNPLSFKKMSGVVCHICSKEYSSNGNMLRHYRTHFEAEATSTPKSPKKDIYDDSIYCCPDCGGMFSSEEWEKHKELHKKKNCNECGKVFQFQSELDQHRSVHLNLKLYRDSKTQNYKSTMASPNGEQPGNVVLLCEVCDRMFTSKDKLKEHKLTHDKKMPILESVVPTVVPTTEEPKSSKFACIPCNKTYAAYSGLWDHNRKKHSDKSPQSSKFPKKCEYCEKVFNTGGSYFMHKQMHERNNQMMSQVTPKKEPVQYKKEPVEIIEEIEDDTESYHTCKRCFKVFSTRYSLKSHMKCHGVNLSPTGKTFKKSNKKVWCDICHCAFENISHLERHKSEDHDIDDTMPVLSDEESEDMKVPFVFTCDVCVQTFTTKAALKKHKEKHAKEDRPVMRSREHLVYCKYCKISFANPNQLNNHMKDEHMEGGSPTKSKEKSKQCNCKVCGKTFNSVSAMITHQGWHKRVKSETAVKSEPNIKEEPDGVEFQCKRCNAVLPNDTALQIHILEKHRNVNATVLPARCSMCNLDFNSQDEYEQHKSFHAIVERQPKKTFPCVHCPAAFSKPETLKVHVRQFHRDQEQQEYQCHHCNRIFEKANSLSIHLKVHEKQQKVTGAVSSGKKLYSCSICSEGFDLPKDLRMHTIQAHPF